MYPNINLSEKKLKLDNPDVLPFLFGASPRARRVINGNVIFLIRRISEDDFNESEAAVLDIFAYFVHERAFYHVVIILTAFNMFFSFSPKCVDVFVRSVSARHPRGCVQADGYEFERA